MSDNFFRVNKGLTLSEQPAEPANPVNGDMYYDTVLQQFRRYENGAWKSFGSGSGFGINYIENPDAEVNTDGWVLYNDTLTLASTGSLVDELGDFVNAGANSSFYNGQKIRYVASAVPIGGLTSGNDYYIANVGGVEGIAVTFQLTSTLGGTPINLTSDGTGNHAFMPYSAFNGIGGTATISWDRSLVNPLRGLASYVFNKLASNSLGQGVAYDFTIDDADLSKMLQCSFEYSVDSGVYADGDVSVGVYDVTNAQMMVVSNTSLVNVSGSDKFNLEFIANNNSTSYRLVIFCSSASALAFSLKMDNFILGPTLAVYGSIASDWKPTNITGNLVTNTTYQSFEKIVGDTAQYIVNIKFTGSPGAFSGINLNLPTGRSIDYSKLPTLLGSGDNATIGHFNTYKQANEYAGHIILGPSSPTTVSLARYRQIGTDEVDLINSTDTFGGGNFINGNSLNATFSVPLIGFSSTVQMSSSIDYDKAEIGMVHALASNVIPSGFLLCNGAAVSRTAYADLFSVIGTRHGTGDGSTTFNIPDYRGRFLRGHDGGIARDPDRAARTAMNAGGSSGDNVGSIQTDAFRAHNHTQNTDLPSGSVVTGGGTNSVGGGAPTGTTGGNETRPINAYVEYVIRFAKRAVPRTIATDGSEPVGSMKAFAGFTAPIGYLLCSGSLISRETYVNLFNTITINQPGTRNGVNGIITGLSDTSNMVAGMPVSGTGIQANSVILSVNSGSQITLNLATLSAGTSTVTIAPYGVGDGVNTFNLPDLRGRGVAGRDDMGGSLASRLTSATMSGTGAGTLLGSNGGAETHSLTANQNGPHTHSVPSYAVADQAGPTATSGVVVGPPQPLVTASSGLGAPHNNVQPTLIANWIIKA